MVTPWGAWVRGAVAFGPNGGTAGVVGADGAVFTLRVPKGASVQDADITLTPPADIRDLPPAGGFVAGVDLEPNRTPTFAPGDPKVTGTVVRPDGADGALG